MKKLLYTLILRYIAKKPLWYTGIQHFYVLSKKTLKVTKWLR